MKLSTHQLYISQLTNYAQNYQRKAMNSQHQDPASSLLSMSKLHPSICCCNFMLHCFCCIISLRSSLGCFMSHGTMLYFSTSRSITLGVRKAGRTGPMRMLRIPRCSKDSRTATAFCSNHEKLIDNGRELTSVWRVSASAEATTTAPYESLHWPMSRSRGKPVEPRVPNSSRLKRYFAQPIVSINVSGGRDLASVVKYERLFSEPSHPPMTKMRFSSPDETAFNTCTQ